MESLGRRLREEVRRRTYLTVGVGIAPTKTLAKLANYAAKTWHKTGGVVDLSAPARMPSALHKSCAANGSSAGTSRCS
ncbi:hypothetical protein ACK8UV_004561 [Serratia marcescens]